MTEKKNEKEELEMEIKQLDYEIKTKSIERSILQRKVDILNLEAEKAELK